MMIITDFANMVYLKLYTMFSHIVPCIINFFDQHDILLCQVGLMSTWHRCQHGIDTNMGYIYSLLLSGSNFDCIF